MPQLAAMDGTALAYDVIRPADPRAAIIWMGGWSDHRTRWRAAAERLREAGYAVYLVDQRGQGDSGGPRGHLSRFSQLLGDLQAVRRLVRLDGRWPQILLGHSFGGLVVLRYLEMQPSDPVAAAVLSGPWLATALRVPLAKRVAARLLADLWPTCRFGLGLDARDLAHDPAVGASYDADPAVHHVMTPGAWHEIRWAQRVVPADGARIECPLLFQLAGADRIVDAGAARDFAATLRTPLEVRWYLESCHELLLDADREQVMQDLIGFLGQVG
jgi:alpha-beta hydrolase superfamily lysophospholipase